MKHPIELLLIGLSRENGALTQHKEGERSSQGPEPPRGNLVLFVSMKFTYYNALGSALSYSAGLVKLVGRKPAGAWPFRASTKLRDWHFRKEGRRQL